MCPSFIFYDLLNIPFTHFEVSGNNISREPLIMEFSYLFNLFVGKFCRRVILAPQSVIEKPKLFYTHCNYLIKPLSAVSLYVFNATVFQHLNFLLFFFFFGNLINDFIFVFLTKFCCSIVIFFGYRFTT
jgi:hypothetical protein